MWEKLALPSVTPRASPVLLPDIPAAPGSQWDWGHCVLAHGGSNHAFGQLGVAVWSIVGMENHVLVSLGMREYAASQSSHSQVRRRHDKPSRLGSPKSYRLAPLTRAPWPRQPVAGRGGPRGPQTADALLIGRRRVLLGRCESVRDMGLL